MQYVDKLDKENGLIRLTVGQVCSAGTAHNIYTGERKIYASPFMHTVSVRKELPLGYASRTYTAFESKDVGCAIRIANDGVIISNPSYRGNAIIAFLDKVFRNCDIHSVRVVRVNKRSVNVEPVDYKYVEAEATNV